MCSVCSAFVTQPVCDLLMPPADPHCLLLQCLGYVKERCDKPTQDCYHVPPEWWLNAGIHRMHEFGRSTQLRLVHTRPWRSCLTARARCLRLPLLQGATRCWCGRVASSRPT